MDKTKKHIAFDEACRLVGGQARMARILGVKPPTVNQWVHCVKPIPAEQCPKIEKAVNGAVICEELNHDVDWSYLRGSTPKQESVEHVITKIVSNESKKVLVIDTPNRREDERRHSERRDGDRRRNSNGGGRRVGERRVGDRREGDRRG